MADKLKSWTTLKEEIVYSAQPFLDVVKQTIKLPDGDVIDDFYQVHLRNFVVVVPVINEQSILTIRQYKHGAGCVSLTFPAGYVEDFEDPETACKRELLEETGYRAGTLTHMGEFVDNGNQRGCIGNYYVATECVQIAEPNPGDLEEMQIEILTSQQVDLALKRGDLAIIHHASVWAMARMQGLI